MTVDNLNRIRKRVSLHRITEFVTTLPKAQINLQKSCQNGYLFRNKNPTIAYFSPTYAYALRHRLLLLIKIVTFFFSKKVNVQMGDRNGRHPKRILRRSTFQGQNFEKTECKQSTSIGSWSSQVEKYIKYRSIYAVYSY